MRKKELEQSLNQVQNPLKNIMQEIARDLALNQNFFLCDNVVHKPKKIPEKTVKKSHHKKNYSPTKVKSKNLLTNISYNRLKNIDFDNASFIIDCYTYILSV